MAEGTDAQPASRVRGNSVLLVGGGAVLVVALAVVIGLLVAGGGSAGRPTAAAPASPSASSSTSTSVSQIYNQVGPSVAVVQTAKGSLGAGFIATTSGMVLTADHVIADGSPITIVFADGTKSSATVASADKSTDVAVLAPATLPQPIVPATLGGAAAVGDEVVAIGNPLGLTYSVSSGVVSGLNRSAKTADGKFSGMIQFDASVNPGSSGGPLLNAKGDVVGIVDSIAVPDGKDAFSGIAFAVPIGTALGGGSGKGPGGGPQL
jgi:putative serine protease PepD